MHQCKKCNQELMLCPSDWPGQDEIWFCPDCECPTSDREDVRLLLEKTYWNPQLQYLKE